MKFLFCASSVVLLALILLDNTQAAKVIRPKFKEFTLWSDEKFITHNITIDTSDPHVNFTLNVQQQLDNVDIHLEALITHKQDLDHFFSLNTTINFCKILKYKAKSPLGSLLTAMLNNYGKLVEKCPIAKGYYYLHKIWIPEDTTFASLSEMDFDINYRIYHVDASKQKTLIANDHFSGELVVHDVNNVKPGLLALLPLVRIG